MNEIIAGKFGSADFAGEELHVINIFIWFFLGVLLLDDHGIVLLVEGVQVSPLVLLVTIVRFEFVIAENAAKVRMIRRARR